MSGAVVPRTSLELEENAAAFLGGGYFLRFKIPKTTVASSIRSVSTSIVVMRVTPLLEGITLPSHTGAHIISCSDFPCQFAALPGGFSVFIAACKKSCNLSITAHFWRRVRDLNPRDAHHAYTISNRAPSTTQPTLQNLAAAQSARFIIHEICVSVNTFFKDFLMNFAFFCFFLRNRQKLPFSIRKRAAQRLSDLIFVRLRQP